MAEKIGLREKAVLGILALLLVTGGVWRAVQVSAPVPELIQAGHAEEQAPDNPEPELITVHLVGAVRSPGVYHLPAGARVYQLLELGGGFREEADREAINLARPLYDGEQIYVSSIGESPALPTGGSSMKININKASAAELTALPGIGEVRANQIVAHREKHGFFTDITEIMDVSGIGEATFNNIAELITVY